jgi:hypothetical protein
MLRRHAAPPCCPDRRARLWHAENVRELRIAGIGVAPEVVRRASAATQLATLEDLLQFGFSQRPVWDLVELIVQDEYTHDVIVRGPEPGFLVFDTT